jgi:16S rRNA (guanine(966)-N(2))-methyltransferase RsmD
MRVIAGKFKGRRLATPKNMTVRPTTDRVKESVFSILREHVINTRFLDLCAGTGNIGIEALSRGAKQVTFLEQNLKCLRLIERNLQACGLETSDPKVQLIRRDVTKGIVTLRMQDEAFELIYFDPPYSAEIYIRCLMQISDACILQSTGMLLVEHHKHTELPLDIGSLRCNRQKQYGDTCVSFYRYTKENVHET